jgi:glycerate kinase
MRKTRSHPRSSRLAQRAFTVVVAPSGFKESLSAEEVADRIAEGIHSVCPRAKVLKAPMADGGEGFTQALVQATGGWSKAFDVTGPLGQRVEAHVGLLGEALDPVKKRTAVIEMAAAAGLRLVPRDQRNPMVTTSYGVGELIQACLDQGAERILIGCGDSGINDAGVGMAQALGAKFLDADGHELPRGGGALERLDRIDLSGLDPRLAHVQIDAAVNWHNMLLGERGVARVFGPQKGATPEQVVQLERGLELFARLVQATTGHRLAEVQGAGASGGLGASLHALLGGQLHPRYDIVMQYLQLDQLLAQADLVITAEGSLDAQTPFGKVPVEVARRAKLQGLPVIALAGCLGDGVIDNLQHGIDAFANIQPRPCTLEESMRRSHQWLSRTAADAMRLLGVGQRLGAALG